MFVAKTKGLCVSAEPEFFHCIVVVICGTRNRDDNFSDIVAFLGGIYKDTQRGILPFGAAFPLLVHKFEKNIEEMSVFGN